MKFYVIVFLFLWISCSPALGKEPLVYLTPSWGVPSSQLLEDFKKQSGLVVEIRVLDLDGIRQQILDSAESGSTAPDVIYVGMDHIGDFSRSGFLQPLDDLISQVTFKRVMGTRFFRVKDVSYAVPLYQQMVMVDLDQQALNKVGVLVEEIKTWDDFYQVSLKLKMADVSEYPIAFGGRSWSWYLIALSMGSTLFDRYDTPLFARPEDPAYSAFELLVRFFKEGLIAPEMLTSPNPHPNFWNGKAVFHQAWQGSLSIANNPEKSKIAPHAEYLLLPNRHFTWSLSAGLAISSHSKQKKGAKKFISFMLNEATQRHTFQKHGMFPSLKKLFLRLGNRGQIDGFKTMAEQTRYIRSLPYDRPWFNQFDMEATQTLIRVAKGEQTVEEGLQALATFQKELKAQDNY